MDRFDLATIAKWAGSSGIDGRKRLQKVVYFLQAAGCPFYADFTIHHYGPYSKDVADVCDEMVAAHLLEEAKKRNSAGIQYRYALPEHVVGLLQKSNKRAPGRASRLKRFKELGIELLNENLWQLELGSTIHYFYRETRSWTKALEKACAFKEVSAEHSASLKALKLAQSVTSFAAF